MHCILSGLLPCFGAQIRLGLDDACIVDTSGLCFGTVSAHGVVYAHDGK